MKEIKGLSQKEKVGGKVNTTEVQEKHIFNYFRESGLHMLMGIKIADVQKYNFSSQEESYVRKCSQQAT